MKSIEPPVPIEKIKRAMQAHYSAIGHDLQDGRADGKLLRRRELFEILLDQIDCWTGVLTPSELSQVREYLFARKRGSKSERELIETLLPYEYYE